MSEIQSLNLDDLDLRELERRLEMAVAMAAGGTDCTKDLGCGCPALTSCGTFCTIETT